MIILKRQMIVWIFWTVILSFEASIGLPLVSLFIFFKDLDAWGIMNTKNALKTYFGLIYISFLISIFYDLSLGWTALICFIYYFLRSFFGLKFFKRDRLLWQILQFVLFSFLAIYIFIAAKLQFNFFFLLQLLVTALIAAYRKKIKLR